MHVWEGWRFAILMTVLIAIMSAAYLIQGGFNEPSVLGAIRATARTSGILFLLAFAAPGIRWGRARRWFERNASSLLLAFAGSHLIHFLLLVAWVALFPDSLFEELSIPFVAVALVLYGVIFILARAALRSMNMSSLQLNARERVGMYVLWAVFAFAFGARALAGPLYPVLAVMSVTALVLRLGSRKRNQVLGEAG
jgi:sulfoxide reductase heme-binding subunit YedZ